MVSYSIPRLARNDKWVYLADAITFHACISCKVNSPTLDYNKVFNKIPVKGKCSIRRPYPYDTVVDEYLNKHGWEYFYNEIRPKGLGVLEMLGLVGFITDLKRILFEETDPGFVYLMQEENGLCKIGRATDTNQRLGSVRTDSPNRVDLLHDFFSADYKEAEKKLHERFATKRIRGEWFSLNSDDIASIKAIPDERDANDIPYYHMDANKHPDVDLSKAGIPFMKTYYRLRDAAGLAYLKPDSTWSDETGRIIDWDSL